MMRVEIHVTAGPAKGQHFTFDKPDSFLFGRASDAHISVPNDLYVSRQHFLLEISPPACKLTDLNSKNGVIVNGVRYGGRTPRTKGVQQAPAGVKEVRLNNGDEVVVGETRIRVLIREKPDTRKAATRSQFLDQSVRCSSCGKEMMNDVAGTASVNRRNPLCETCRGKLHRAELKKILNDASAQKTASRSDKRIFPDDHLSIDGYEINQEIKHGGPGKIYRATKLDTGMSVVVKVLSSQTEVDPYTIRSFQREMNIIRQLKHRHIVRFIEHGEQHGVFCFIFEFIDGMDLPRFLRERGGRISLDEAAPFWLEILDGLSYAHRTKIVLQNTEGKEKVAHGIVHRNLKPQNILLARKGESWIPKITDFGLAKSFESAGFTDITVPGDVLGTPVYWPREQITHYRYLNPATDVFSIASVFYEMVTGTWVRHGFKELFQKCKQLGRLPSISDYMMLFASNPPIPIRQRESSIPEPVAQVIDRALREQEVSHDIFRMRETLKNLRYPDAGVFREALLKAFKEAGIMGALRGNQEDADTSHRRADESPSADAIMYSAIQPATRKDVALLLLDVVGSTRYILEKGDTDFSTLIGSILRRVRKHPASSLELVFLKSTGDGFLAVFRTVPVAFAIAQTFLKKPVFPNVHFRLALHWGTVNTGPDGDVIGTEVRRVFRVERVSPQDRLEPAPRIGEIFPTEDRIIATQSVIDQLPDADKARFHFAGKFRLSSTGRACCDLWVLHE